MKQQQLSPNICQYPMISVVNPVNPNKGLLGSHAQLLRAQTPMPNFDTET